MRKIFYRESDLKIIGMSDGENSLDFPFVETKINYHSTENLKIIKDDKGVAKLVITKGSL